MDKKFWNKMKLITILSLVMVLLLGSDIPWKELNTIRFSWQTAKTILYDIAVGVFSSMILVWCIDRIQLRETERQDAKQRLILYNKLSPVLTDYYEFYLFLYIATRDKNVDIKEPVLKGLYYCKDEFISQILNNNPFYKDGYYADATKVQMQLDMLRQNSSDQQMVDSIMKMSTNLPWYKCWCKDATEFYNNAMQIERDYVTLFPNELMENFDKLLNIVASQRRIDEIVEGRDLIGLLPQGVTVPQFPPSTFVEMYRIEEVLRLLDEIMTYIENDSSIKLKAREQKFFNDRNVCPSIGYSCEKSNLVVEVDISSS